MKPLSVGNVVSAGLRIYRDNFKKYFKLAFFGYLWVFVPVYGWAKYSAMMGLIPRLAFKEIAEQPESVRDAQRYINPRKWDFFVAGLLVSLIFSGAVFPVIIVFSIIVGIAGAIFSETASGIFGVFMVLFIIAFILFLIFGTIWLVSKLFLVELPIAVEENVNAANSISRSWQLTKGSVGRIQLIVFLVFLISLPVGIVIQILSAILQLAISTGLENAPGLAIIGIPIYIILLAVSGALLIPIWQCVKAVIYYDLRLRREGMGINLRK